MRQSWYEMSLEEEASALKELPAVPELPWFSVVCDDGVVSEQVVAGGGSIIDEQVMSDVAGYIPVGLEMQADLVKDLTNFLEASFAAAVLPVQAADEEEKEKKLKSKKKKKKSGPSQVEPCSGVDAVSSDQVRSDVIIKSQCISKPCEVLNDVIITSQCSNADTPQLCKHFIKGRCWFGDRCMHPHPLINPVMPSPAEAHDVAAPVVEDGSKQAEWFLSLKREDMQQWIRMAKDEDGARSAAYSRMEAMWMAWWHIDDG